MEDTPYKSNTELAAMHNSREFSKKTILISGAAQGIGRETAIVLSNLGARIILMDIDSQGSTEVIKGLSERNHVFYEHDLADIGGIGEKVKKIIEECGAIDGFVHCVGVRSRRPLAMLSPKIALDVMQVNFFSFLEIVRSITKKNHYKPGLSIVGISSISSQRGGASVTAYAASKAAMESAVRCLAKELAPKQIRLNTVVPAQINTPAYNDLISKGTSGEDATLARQYLGLGEPIDVANAIVFLLSNQARFISGSAIPVDGGFLSS